MPDATESPGPSPAGVGFTAPVGDFGVRMQHLAGVTAEFAAADTVDEVGRVVTSSVVAAVRASVATLIVYEHGRLRLVDPGGGVPEVAARWASFAPDAQTPAGEAMQTGHPVVVAGGAELAQRYPLVGGDVPAGHSIVCVPLHSGAQRLGVIALRFSTGWVPGTAELDFLAALANAATQALRRIHTAQTADDQATQLRFLAAASEELASSLDYRATLAKVAKLAVRLLADWCAVDILQDGGLTTLAVEHVDPGKVALAWQVQQRYPPDPDAPIGPPNVVRTGVSELHTHITDNMLVAGAQDEEHLRLSRGLGLRSALVVPLKAQDRTIGAISLIRAETGHPFTAADLAVAEDLGRRASVAIENAHLHTQTRDVALQLQRAVLPARLTHFPGWQIATYYSPGGDAEVGGDFYGATVLPDGALAVFIGDVMGHGIPAAAAMAQMRAAVRAYLCIDPDPGAVLTSIDTMFDLLGWSQLVSLTYAVVDPSRAQVSVANAGHCPPLLLDPEGRAGYVVTPPRRILGAGGDERVTTTHPFAPGSTLLLYTDGLIERRDEIIDLGLDRLARAATTLAGDPLQPQLDRLAEQVCDDTVADDVTAIAVRPRRR